MIIKVFNVLKDYSEKHSEDVPGQANLIYLLVAFPVLAVISIILALLKKYTPARVCSIFAGIISLLCIAVTFLLVNFDELKPYADPTGMLYVFAIITIISFFIGCKDKRQNA